MATIEQSRNTEQNFLRSIVTPRNPEIDFVAIHGLNPVNTRDFALKTWTAGDGTEWLKNDKFLPLHFPKARVLLFGYNSNVAFQSSSAGVEQHVCNLLDHLQRERAQCPTRPLVFLCHSLGGLIAKRAMVTAKLDGQYGPVYQATRAFVFFGTPHWGSKKTKIGGIAAKIARAVQGEVDNTILDALKENSLFSEALRSDFRALHDNFSLLSFYETHPTKKLKSTLNLGTVVTMTSATLDIPHERVLPRETDHSGVCTYDDPESDAFKQLVENLKRMVNGPTITVSLATGALVLPAGRGALKQWNFTDMDIATMAGAGRNTVTWMTAGFKDRSLLEYHDVRFEDLLLRKGIIETAELQKRWGKNLKLLKNGKQEVYQTTVKDDLDIFTWVMVLIYAALNVALSDGYCRDIMIDFVVKLFDGDSDDYLRGELPSHIEGWNSIASVRMVNQAAREKWFQLENSGEHQPGYIPETDSRDILDLLLWLTTERTQRYDTASSDVYCLAKILWTLGVKRLMAVEVERLEDLELDENQLVVVLNKGFIRPTGAPASLASQRRGIRVPLNNMREAISPWPLSLPNRPTLLLNDMLDDFSSGERAGKDLQFSLDCESEIPYTATTTNQTKTDLYYKISPKGSMEKVVHRGILADLAKEDFLLVTSALWKALEERFKTYPQHLTREGVFNDEAKFARYQCFVLGYYYGALSQLVLNEQLTTKEAFGSWGWWDKEIFSVVRDMKYEAPKYETPNKPRPVAVYCWRFGVMKVAAYLFAGADLRLIRSPGLDHRATGVVGKLCLLTASMIGEANDAEAASKFFLLDIDRSCIPNTSGIVVSGSRATPGGKTITPDMLRQLPVDSSTLQGVPEDFTVHIEPDWDHDNQKCMVVYRDSGRIVHRLSPADCDAATVLCAHPDTTKAIAEPVDREDVYFIPLSTFHGGKVATRDSRTSAVAEWASTGTPPDINDKAFIVPTMGLPRARTCLKAMFFDSLAWTGSTPNEPYSLHPSLKRAYVLYDQDARPIVLP